ncbi:MAG: leucine-rich repeat protein [Oscillospiraceae bacterium]
MIKSYRFQNKGFTLIELILVVAILGILIALSIPVFTNNIEKARTAADAATLRTLNYATRVFEAGGPSPNPFETAYTGDDALMQTLVDSGFIADKVEPQQKDAAFSWNFDNKIWILSTTHVLTFEEILMGSGGQTGYIKGSYTFSAKDIIIPKTLDGVTVTHIYQDVFNGDGLASVTFPSDSGVIRIHARAFMNNDLTEIVLPNSLLNLDYGAFLNNSIVKITIGANVVLEGNVFRNNNNFRDAYYSQGAGTYKYINGNWVKQ